MPAISLSHVGELHPGMVPPVSRATRTSDSRARRAGGGGPAGGRPFSGGHTEPLDTRGNKCASNRPTRRQKPLPRAEYEAARQKTRGGQSRAVASSYDALGEGLRASRVRSCGRLAAYVCESGCGTVAGRNAYHCKDRLCPYCAARRGAQLAEKFLPLIQEMANPLLLTLTVKNGPHLAERGRHLLANAKRLRRQKVWKDHIPGGISVEEVAHGGVTHWHPHLHMVIDSDLPAPALYALLRAAWHALTGDSFIVDVRPLTGDDLPAAVRELCKYTAKLSGIVHYPALVGEFTRYAARHRMVVPFGNCHGRAELADVDAETPEVEHFEAEELACPSCAAVGTMRRAPGRGWSKAEAIPDGRGSGWWVRGNTPVDWARVLQSRPSRTIGT